MNNKHTTVHLGFKNVSSTPAKPKKKVVHDDTVLVSKFGIDYGAAVQTSQQPTPDVDAELLDEAISELAELAQSTLNKKNKNLTYVPIYTYHHTGHRRDYLNYIKDHVSGLLRGNNIKVSVSTGGVHIVWGKVDPAKFPTEGLILNSPDSTATARNKLSTLDALQRADVAVVPFTSKLSVAMSWVKSGNSVYARQELYGCGGEGICIFNNDSVGGMSDTCQHTKLFTLGITSDELKEFRVHIGKQHDGTIAVIDVTQKLRRKGWKELPTFNSLVRNHSTGWVYCRNNIKIPTVVLEESKKAATALGVDFGAIDVMYVDGLVYVLECNTAPGLDSPTTIDAYSKFFYNRVKDWAANV